MEVGKTFLNDYLYRLSLSQGEECFVCSMRTGAAGWVGRGLWRNRVSKGASARRLSLGLARVPPSRLGVGPFNFPEPSFSLLQGIASRCAWCVCM